MEALNPFLFHSGLSCPRSSQKWIQPPACLDHGLYRILAHFYLMKKYAKGLHYFGLDCGMLEFFTHEPYFKNNCCLSHIFGARFGGKDRGLCTYKPWSEQAGGLDAFLYLAAQNFEIFSNI